MRFSDFPSRHGRLACLCLASLLVHLLALALLGARLAPPDLAPMGALAVRLAESRPVPAPAPPSRAALAPAPAVPETAAANTRLPSLVRAVPAPAAAPGQAGTAPQGAGGTLVPVQMPGRYRVTPPPSARLDYLVVRSAPGAAPVAEGGARLEWDSDGNTYSLRLDGVLGERASEGGTDDAGIAPLRATVASGAGTATTVFDRERLALVDGAGGKAVRLALGAQDGASVLMQLAGIGLADADQMRDVLEIVVSDGNGPAIARFEVLGKESVETGAGALEAVRLVRLAPPGSARLDVWLAPQRDWLPVQLRVSAPDGTVRTQTLAPR